MQIVKSHLNIRSVDLRASQSILESALGRFLIKVDSVNTLPCLQSQNRCHSN